MQSVALPLAFTRGDLDNYYLFDRDSNPWPFPVLYKTGNYRVYQVGDEFIEVYQATALANVYIYVDAYEIGHRLPKVPLYRGEVKFSYRLIEPHSSEKEKVAIDERCLLIWEAMEAKQMKARE